jgi:MYXO-CTERM domain-containing protein
MDPDLVDPESDAAATDAIATDADALDDPQTSDATDAQPPPLDLEPDLDARRSRPDVREGSLDAAPDPAPTRRGPTGGCDCALGPARPGHVLPWLAFALFWQGRRRRRGRQPA